MTQGSGVSVAQHLVMTATSNVEPMSLPDVTRVSREIAADYDPRLQVIGVASTSGESGRVELLLTIQGCHREPCVIMLNVTRVGHAAFEHELRAKFFQALQLHLRDSPPAS